MSKKTVKLTIALLCLIKTATAVTISFGYHKIKNPRKTITEDYVFDPKETGKNNFFGVFDGHGGHEVAQKASLQLPDFLTTADYLNGKTEQKDIVEALQRGVVNFDVEHCSKGSETKEQTAGTTACFIYIPDNSETLYCTNLGDSRAVLYGRSGVQPLSLDHKPETEKGRVELAGGYVANPDGKVRVNGRLETSRALGDSFNDLKKTSELKMIEVGTLLENFPNHPVGNVPDIRVVELTNEHEFIVIASDGMWDVMENEEVGSFAKDGLCAGKSLEKIATELAEKAKNKRAKNFMRTDDISVVIVTVNEENVFRSRNWNDNSLHATEEGIKAFSGFVPTAEAENALALRRKKEAQDNLDHQAKINKMIDNGFKKHRDEQKTQKLKMQKVVTIAGIGLGVAGVGAGIWHWERISKWWNNWKKKKNKDK